jgi:hypothetical protein
MSCSFPNFYNIIHCGPGNPLSHRERVGVRGSKQESYCFTKPNVNVWPGIYPLIPAFALREKGLLRVPNQGFHVACSQPDTGPDTGPDMESTIS